MNEDAARLYHDMFVESPCDRFMRGVLDNSSKYAHEEMLDHAERVASKKDWLDFQLLQFLSDNGREDFVSNLIFSKGFCYQQDPWNKSLSFPGSYGLCKSLADKGRFEESALVARGIIDLIVERKDVNCYEGGTELLRFMDSRKGFEDIRIPHSEYKGKLREEHPRLRKFWGLYDGTYQKDEQKRFRCL